jgi:formylglycine-generating enzyme required for sulfatase activity
MAFRHVSDQKYKCPICGKENTAHETFRCRRCGRQYLCDDHLSPHERVCTDCASAKKKDALDEPGMVVVHDGEFFLGYDEDENAVDAQPMHSLRLERYLMDQFPVTNKEFKEFKPEFEYPEGDDDKPVTNVTWYDANDYAVSKGKRLPSEPEWEKAARSRDKRFYPWGNDLPTDVIEGAEGDLLDALKKYNISPYGCKDMVGGLKEWTSSKYEPYPKGPSDIHGYHQGNMTIRGGMITPLEPSKTYHRSYAHPSEKRDDITFRCCKGAEQVYEKKYAGAEIKRPKKSDMADKPPPEFKALKMADKPKTGGLDHIDYSGLTVKEAIRKSKEATKMSDVFGETPTVGATQPAGTGVPGKLGSDKRQKPVAAPSYDAEIPVEKSKVPWIWILVIILLIVVIGWAVTRPKGTSKESSASETAYEKPRKTTVQSAPGFTQVRNESFFIPTGNKFFDTKLDIKKDDRITIKVINWKEGAAAPPLNAKIGQGPEIPIGASKTFISEQTGELFIGYMAATVVPPEGQEKFVVQVIVEMPEK